MTKYLKVTIEVVEDVHDGPLSFHKVLDAHPQRWLLSHENQPEFLDDVARLTREVARDMVEEFK